MRIDSIFMISTAHCKRALLTPDAKALSTSKWNQNLILPLRPPDGPLRDSTRSGRSPLQYVIVDTQTVPAFVTAASTTSGPQLSFFNTLCFKDKRKRTYSKDDGRFCSFKKSKSELRLQPSVMNIDAMCH